MGVGGGGKGEGSLFWFCLFVTLVCLLGFFSGFDDVVNLFLFEGGGGGGRRVVLFCLFVFS